MNSTDTFSSRPMQQKSPVCASGGSTWSAWISIATSTTCSLRRRKKDIRIRCFRDKVWPSRENWVACKRLWSSNKDDGGEGRGRPFWRLREAADGGVEFVAQW